MKQFGFLFIGLLITSLSFGQMVKIQAGPSISELDWKINGFTFGPLYTKTLIGYSVFAGIDYLDKKDWNLSSNIGLLRKGGKQEFQLTNTDGIPTDKSIVEKATLDYLSINTMLDLKFTIHERFCPFVSFGPQLGYIVAASKHFDGLKNDDWLNKTSYGLLLGGGLKYTMSKIQMGLRTDYYYDFTKVADWTTKVLNGGGTITSKTSSISLIVGYKL
jgi:opacity protein-like surface antigen